MVKFSKGRTRLSPRGAGFLVVLATAAFLAGCSKEAPPPPRPAPQVGVLEIVPKTIPFSPAFVAQTESSRQVNIVARVSGFLDRIAYREGELVKQGQLLFVLDTKPFIAQLNAAEGEVRAQQARLVTAEATYGRVKPLTEQDALPLADLDRAKGELDSAKAALFAAKAKVDTAQLNLGYATITSPVTGLASRALQRQGAFVNSTADSANLTYVAAVDPVWVNFSVSQNQAAKWQEMGRKGEIVPPANQNYEVDIVLPGGVKYPQRGRISFADPSFSQDTGSFMVRAVLPNPKMELRPGMFVTAIMHGAMRPNAIVVPQLAIQQGSEGHMIYVVNADNVAEVRPVVVGDYVGDHDIVVVQGLHAGDRVVVDGVLKVVPGKPVTVVPASAPAPAGAPAAETPGKTSAAAKK
ncbi:MAG: efflux RND transporter periplasmic adaptor subunit [Burkholderiaceae bacterium]|jgi:membrane fusion protein (multidrug efflux system)|nr:efflux RND transporter periplasmic adaptor subunit [Burkholderiaceae bacterium]